MTHLLTCSGSQWINCQLDSRRKIPGRPTLFHIYHGYTSIGRRCKILNCFPLHLFPPLSSSFQPFPVFWWIGEQTDGIINAKRQTCTHARTHTDFCYNNSRCNKKLLCIPQRVIRVYARQDKMF